MKRKVETEIRQVETNIRASWENQLPIIAAILAATQENFDPMEAAEDAIEICEALEEQLS